MHISHRGGLWYIFFFHLWKGSRWSVIIKVLHSLSIFIILLTDIMDKCHWLSIENPGMQVLLLPSCVPQTIFEFEDCVQTLVCRYFLGVGHQYKSHEGDCACAISWCRGKMNFFGQESKFRSVGELPSLNPNEFTTGAWLLFWQHSQFEALGVVLNWADHGKASSPHTVLTPLP